MNNECPRCGSEDIDWGGTERDCALVWFTNTCHACNFSWNEVYKFSHNETADTCEEIE